MTDWNPKEFEDEKIKTCSLPKHKGKLWVDVIEEDLAYVEWLVYEWDQLDEPTYEYLMDLLEGDF